MTYAGLPHPRVHASHAIEDMISWMDHACGLHLIVLPFPMRAARSGTGLPMSAMSALRDGTS
jgi:hypothetical protein